jgi:hypothetical protein
LEAVVVRPDDGEPHPLALISHGSPRKPEDRAKLSPYRLWAQAVAFARRGWTVVSFLRRGYGRSAGSWAEAYGSCARPDYASATGGPNKAFVVNGSHYGLATGRRSIDDAVKDALGFCAPGTLLKCIVVNINDKPAN